MKATEFNLRHLKAFKSVCDTGSVTASSKIVHLSQPAITQGISKLGKQLGYQLFTRSSKGVLPTNVAEIFLNRVVRAFNRLEIGVRRASKSAKMNRPSAFESAITMTQLKALIAVGDHGNFSAAANALGTAQPSLFRAARELEQISGFDLYIKRPKRIELTPAADHLFISVKLALNEIQQGIDEINALQGENKGSIKIGAMPLSRSAILPKAIDDFTHEYPSAKIGIVDGPFDDLLSHLRLGDLDVLIGAMRDPSNLEGVEQFKLFNDQLAVLCHPSHPFTKTPPTINELANSNWVISRKGTPARAQFERFFASENCNTPERLVETSSLIMLRGLLASKERLALVSQSQAQSEIGSGRISKLKIDLNDDPRPIGYTVRSDWQPTELQKYFLKVLHKAKK